MMFKHKTCHFNKFLIVIGFAIVIHFGIKNVSAVIVKNAGLDETGKIAQVETLPNSQYLGLKIDKFYNALKQRLDSKEPSWWSRFFCCLYVPKPRKDILFIAKISRSNVLEDSLEQITKATCNQLLASFFILKFVNEMSYGEGVIQEWLSLLSEQIFDPSSRYFKYTDKLNHVYTLQIRPVQEVTPQDEQFFYFVGRIMGIAIYHKMRLQAHLNKLIYSKVLGKEIKLANLQDVDPAAYNGYKETLKKNPTGWGLDFTVEEKDEHGNTFEHNLKPNEENEELNESNKEEYVRLGIEWKFAPKKQTDAFLKGLGELIPFDLLRKYFDEKELELLLCGIHEIDVEQWKRNTIIEVEKKNPEFESDRQDATNVVKVEEEVDFEFERTITLLEVKDDEEIDSRTIRVFTRWFWEIIEKFGDEKRIKLLEYMTGSPSLPVGGFQALDTKFTLILLRKAYYENVLVPPTTQICHNQISIPIYKDKETLENELEQLIKEPKTFNKF